MANGIMFLLAGNLYCAIDAEAAVQTLEKIVIPVTPVLVLPAATYGVLVHCARGNLHLGHFLPALGAAEALCEVVLRITKGAIFTLFAVRIQSRA